ncbi:MAG: ergothioneine biosynthesis protein EgtB [Pseudomonadota bacterium]
MAFDAKTAERDAAGMIEAYRKVRARSDALAAPLSDEDWMLQPCVEASPVKWNLAHTTWFFETFLLGPAGVEPVDPRYAYLFNSYYQQLGARQPRGERGLLSRPSAADVRAYRREVDGRVEALFETSDEGGLQAVAPILALGLAHEEQHQELLLTDILYAFSMQPFAPAAYPEPDDDAPEVHAGAPGWTAFEPGVFDVGYAGDGFSFDNESPRHAAHTTPFALADQPVTNGDFAAFVADGGYEEPALWLSDGWDMMRRDGVSAPLYWRREGDSFREYSWFGERPLDPDAPVRHLSYYEAEAYANWTGMRLPTEFEWERAARSRPVEGRFLGDGRPRTAVPAGEGPLAGMFGGVWEWTRSAYAAYPGYRAPKGAIGEYNGKFMSGQMVLRGGSLATPEGHVRASYRNFFPPSARWQVSGLRLARDL